MKPKAIRSILVLVLLVGLVLPVTPAAFAQSGETVGVEAAAATSLNWSVQYMIDQSQTVRGQRQVNCPARQSRACHLPRWAVLVPGIQQSAQRRGPQNRSEQSRLH